MSQDERLELNDAEILEIWLERAAIREFDGNQTREEAELGADDDIDRMMSDNTTPGETKVPTLIRNANGTFKSNATLAFESYIEWLRWHPQDYKGATEAASDFIEDKADMDEFENIIREAAGSTHN